MIMQDTSVVIVLTRTVGALEADQKSDPNTVLSRIAVDDAEVDITVNGFMYSLPLVQSGAYQSTDIPVLPGAEYFLTVKSKSLGRVSASTVIRPAIRFDSLAVGSPSKSEYQYLTPVTYTISDSPDRNFYLVTFKNVDRDNLQSSVLRPDGHIRLIDDREFNGSRFTDSFLAVTGLTPRDSVAISIANVDEDYFEYIKTRIQNDLELVEIFSEPVHYQTNVNGGLGYFELHVSDTRLLDLY